MSRLVRLVLLALVTAGLTVQSPAHGATTLFSEDFEDELVPEAGPYPAPDGWILFDEDGRTPVAQTAYVDKAWIVREDFITDPNDQVAISNSWYTPEGQADDWMWSPQFTLSPNATLRWDARAPDPSFPDGYEVRILTGGFAPTSTPADSTVIATIPAENNSWTARQIDLHALGYTSGPVRIGFRNNTDNRFLLFIDDIEVSATEPVVDVTVSVTGPGSVESSPAGIDCPSTDCSASFGDPVTLTPAPDAGARFVRWEGDCTGTGSCEFDPATDGGPAAVTAVFAPTLVASITSASKPEGDSGTRGFRFVVRLSGPAVGDEQISYRTKRGRADRSDYRSTSGVISFAPGQQRATLRVKVFGDTKFERNETFFVRLSDPVNLDVGRGRGRGVIRNDDARRSHDCTGCVSAS